MDRERERVMLRFHHCTALLLKAFFNPLRILRHLGELLNVTIFY